ncbi:hypothetical protein RO3G_00774 [Rhizopus delemar RA 99-880]|uniref:Uncharacterized protein n=1 Tax=Rhizopus delemar (strain RA 99-880 / ATCC MYA-4621 / FGSC 9543 / NRRL 43880) TaxID=246409 RepID=I1BIP0_RHIO9|nr:hypothetical protein RO3G_00774 [Rhizopus delemar RA 99-880]|eukprot:EIE76070.1 hypothetical protein RO3G_00774 [Rhizopus delemar RA 99-880]
MSPYTRVSRTRLHFGSTINHAFSDVSKIRKLEFYLIIHPCVDNTLSLSKVPHSTLAFLS